MTKYIGQFIFLPGFDLICVIIAQDEDNIYYVSKSGINSRAIDIGDLPEVVFGVIGTFDELVSKRKGLLVEYKLHMEKLYKEMELRAKEFDKEWLEKGLLKKTIDESSEF